MTISQLTHLLQCDTHIPVAQWHYWKAEIAEQEDKYFFFPLELPRHTTIIEERKLERYEYNGLYFSSPPTNLVFPSTNVRYHMLAEEQYVCIDIRHHFKLEFTEFDKEKQVLTFLNEKKAFVILNKLIKGGNK